MSPSLYQPSSPNVKDVLQMKEVTLERRLHCEYCMCIYELCIIPISHSMSTWVCIFSVLFCSEFICIYVYVCVQYMCTYSGHSLDFSPTRLKGTLNLYFLPEVLTISTDYRQVSLTLEQ